MRNKHLKKSKFSSKGLANIFRNSYVTAESKNDISIKKQEEYWLKIFSVQPPALNMPLDNHRSMIQNFNIGKIELELNKNLIKRLEEIVKKTKSSLYDVLLAGYTTLLYKYTEQNDIIIGLPVMLRQLEMTNSVYKYNTLALRTNPNKDKKFIDFLVEIKQNVSNVYENQDYQLEDITDILKLRGNISGSRLFDTIFLFQDEQYTNCDNLILDDYYADKKQSRYDIGLNIIKNNEKIHLEFEYCKELFSVETIRRFASHYINILNTIIYDANISLADINMLSSQEKEQIICEFNCTKKEYPRNKTISMLFEEQVEKLPDKIAVVFEEDNITYKELNQKSNSLARKLRKKGVKADTIVGIVVDKSIEMIIGMLGILKAGGAYLPIDPNYPKERIEYILGDSKPKILLGKKELLENIDYKGEKLQLSLGKFYSDDFTNLENMINPDNLAYIIYTSGTTGKPKGVMNKHRNAVRLVKGVNYMQFREDDKILQMGSLVFDASIFELWGALLNGLELHLAKKETVVITNILHRYIVENNITIIFSTPELLNQMAEENVDLFKDLRYLLVGGDVLSPKHASMIRTNCKELKIINAYGPTENGTFSTTYSLERECNTSIPIGKPVSNSYAYIIYENGLLKPIGCYGELCVSGDGLARGYLNRQELTAKKFVDNPFALGTKMYKTGDLARWLPDGNIEFLGRKDYQVKIRGFRIELGEVESFLLKQEMIREAVVLAKEDESGNKYLCGYVIASENLTVHKLREKLLKEIPDYMIPSYFVQLDKMPLTPTGKIDRKALSKLSSKLNTGVKYVPPTNEMQHKIANLWQKELGIDKVGINDNFFEIGGNSLKAIRVVSSLAVDFEINTNDIFEYPTISELEKRLTLKEDNLKDKFCKIKEVYKDSDNRDLSENTKEEYNRYREINRKFDYKDIHEQIKYKNILLTGATGYLGVNLLYEILKTSRNCKVFALMRGENQDKAIERLRDKMEFYFGENLYEIYKDRIIIINGDLTKDRFGIPEEIYYKLSKKIDCIIIAAANVKHYGIYSDFYEINVAGIQRLIDFALNIKIKDLKHISTMSVASGKINDKEIVLFTEYDCDMGQEIENFYVKTKFLAEKLVIEARDKGINTSIFRIGNLMFNSDTGKFQENIKDNAFYTLIKSLMKIGAVPSLNINSYDFSFVDNVRKAFVLLYNRKGAINEIYHLSNPNTVSIAKIGDFINQAELSYKLNKMETELFLDYLYDNYNNPKVKKHIEDFLLHSELFDINDKTNFVNTSDKTNMHLKALGFDWLRLDKDHIRKMIQYCEEVEFL
ncbi:amino acid adenylation domain-containing protein [Clostridiaceae bacterium M8S5]|nr:amino acid adenylation domain-containing protein [Clostridiaceae bacterium M8S5]